MSLANAITIGRKRRRRGQLWPMPVRETDLGPIYVDVTIRALPKSRREWTGRLLVDTGATDTFVPGAALRKLGIRPARRRAYELADGTWQELDIGFGAIEDLKQHRRCRVAFEPIINDFNGRRSVEMQILDFQFPAGT